MLRLLVTLWTEDAEFRTNTSSSVPEGVFKAVEHDELVVSEQLFKHKAEDDRCRSLQLKLGAMLLKICCVNIDDIPLLRVHRFFFFQEGMKEELSVAYQRPRSRLTCPSACPMPVQTCSKSFFSRDGELLPPIIEKLERPNGNHLFFLTRRMCVASE